MLPPAQHHITLAESVSPRFFQELYDLKLQTLRRTSLADQLLPATISTIARPSCVCATRRPKRIAVLVQAEMDVDADGSDSDRLPAINRKLGNQTVYQLSLEKKRPRGQALSARGGREIALRNGVRAKGLMMERNRDLRIGIQRMKAEVDSLKRFSFLVAANDPYIVLPEIFPARRTLDGWEIMRCHLRKRNYPATWATFGPKKVGEAFS